MTKIDWESALDYDGAAKNVRSEFPGDWYRDPWGWPEIDYVVRANRKVLTDHFDSQRSYAVEPIDVPKENWGSRPAVVLPVLDRLAYQAIVDRFSVNLVGGLHRSTYGWRLKPEPSPTPGDYSHNSLQWDVYRSHLKEAGWSFDAALRTDLVSCFASIPIDKLQGALDDLLPQGALSSWLTRFLGQMNRTPLRQGLPQRSLASAVIANMYLSVLDDVLDHHAQTVPSWDILLPGKTPKPAQRSWTRWMDDIWLFGHDAGEMRSAQLELQKVARTLGMTLNSAKTEVLEGEDVATHALEIEHSAIDDALENDEGESRLEELVDRLLEDPSKAGRTSLRFALVRMQRYESRYRVDDLLALACRMPHAADALAPLLAERIPDAEFQDWLLEYSGGPWATFDWSIAQYVRALSSQRPPSNQLLEFVQERIADGRSSLVLLAACARKLVEWNEGSARAVLQAAHGDVAGPLQRRVVALAGHESGLPRPVVKGWLAQDDDNAVTLSMLSSTNFAKAGFVAA